MARKIILLSDGTGNSSAKIWRTNVWRMFEAIDLSGSDQVAFYDDGVGTSSFKLWAMFSGAFGFGLKRNVIDIYKFACRNHRDNADEIFGFGFSRGAFTIRVVIGLILDQGLIDAEDIDDSTLDKLAHRAYQRYRRRHFHTNWGLLLNALRWRLGWGEQNPAVDPDADAKIGGRPGRPLPCIRFLGLWDTVAAYGLPIDEMTRGVSQWIWPLEIPSHELHPSVKRACHALAVDDARTTFHPVLWNERHQPPPPLAGPRYTIDERISQVWFAGMHANVGGGYPDDSLAKISLYWIMEEARACGLRLKCPPAGDPDALAQTRSAQDKDGRLYNSRSGFSSYYRFGPRKIADLCQQKFSRTPGDEVYIACPKIHESVLNRIKNNAHVYSPIGIPSHYDIVRKVVVKDKPDDKANEKVLFEIVLPVANPFETPADATARANAQERLVWRWVFVRALFYFGVVIATIAFVIYPISGRPQPAAELSNPLRWVSDIIRLFGTILPSSASRWINGYAQSPGIFLLFVAAFLGLTWIGRKLEVKISDRMSELWKASFNHRLADPGAPAGFWYRLRTKWFGSIGEGWKFAVAPALSALLIAYFTGALASHALFNIYDDAGFTCTAADKAVDVPKEGLLFNFRASELCHATQLTLQGGKSYAIAIDPPPEDLPPNYAALPSTCTADDLSQIQIRGITATPAGVPTFDGDDQTLTQIVTQFFLTPLRREFNRPWFATVVRYGPVGGEEAFIDPDPYKPTASLATSFGPKVTDQLFIFLNDAVVGVRGLFQTFYQHDRGCISVFIRPK
jgi:uncharacterized protein (DUF2235 family)